MTNETPEKMSLESMDVAGERRAELQRQLGATFPEVFSEEGIDFDQLKRVLGDWVEPGKERFGLNWPGKAECMKIIQQPSVATLKPVREESVNFDETKNLFIEGDNLEVLKLLQKAYFGKVKMIYIDPPYNTGKEFIYPDKFSETLDTYLAYTGQVDDEGRKFATNSDTVGRYHSNWLNMMYPRLYLARSLLQEDGVIFISIDDNEVSRLRELCDSVFGEENFLTQFAWRTDGNFDNQAKIKKCHEYILMYCKNEEFFPHPPIVDPNTPSDSKLFRPEIRNTIVKNGLKNPISTIILPAGFPVDFQNGQIEKRDNSWPHYHETAIIVNGKLEKPVTVESGWSSKELLEEFIDSGFSAVMDQKGQHSRFVVSNTGAVEVIKKRSDTQSHVISSLLNMGGPQKGSAELEELGVVFDDYPKPVGLIEYFIQMNEGTDFLVFDFFAGSGTTAHAVMKVNKSDGGDRKFILVQLPEPCRDNSMARNAGFKTISEITRDRIRRAANKLQEDSADQFDLNGEGQIDSAFKVFKLDRSNFKVWDGDAEKVETLGEQLDLHVDHVAKESDSEDILYELLLKAGFSLTTKVEKQELSGKKVFSIKDGALLICLEKEITSELIDALAEAEPLQVICLDEAFKGNDQLKTNAVQTFKARAQTKESEIVFKTV